jgi:hypothetical protein
MGHGERRSPTFSISQPVKGGERERSGHLRLTRMIYKGPTPAGTPPLRDLEDDFLRSSSMRAWGIFLSCLVVGIHPPVLMRFIHVARLIVNANHSIMRAAVETSRSQLCC